MCECWKYKATDRPSFTILMAYMEDALTRQCPDLSLIPRFEGEVLPRQIDQTQEGVRLPCAPHPGPNGIVTPTAPPPYTLVSAITWAGAEGKIFKFPCEIIILLPTRYQHPRL